MSKNRKRIGILTGGGDCPGLNAVIRGAVKSADRLGYDMVGFLSGFEMHLVVARTNDSLYLAICCHQASFSVRGRASRATDGERDRVAAYNLIGVLWVWHNAGVAVAKVPPVADVALPALIARSWPAL